METAEANTHTMRAQIELRRQILSGKLAGGTRLYEVALAEKLQISRTPVREAMARLVEEGLLERRDRAGFVVRSFDYDDVIDTLELRGVLEGTAARLGAERGVKESELAHIRGLLAQIGQSFDTDPDSVDQATYFQHNMEFHVAIHKLSSSNVLVRELERIYKLPFASPSAFLTRRMNKAEMRQMLLMSHNDHHGILDAIARREGTRAEALMREHARLARENLQAIFGKDKPRARGLAPLTLEVAGSDG